MKASVNWKKHVSTVGPRSAEDGNRSRRKIHTGTEQVTARYKGPWKILILAQYLYTALGWR